MLLELLSCTSNLHTAVEVTGGNQLFHVVVDNDSVATKIVEVLTRDKMGRATFLPLNRINPSDINYPDHHGSDAVPMLKLLKFSSKFAPAMKQVRGSMMSGARQRVSLAACGQVPSESSDISIACLGAWQGYSMPGRNSRYRVPVMHACVRVLYGQCMCRCSAGPWCAKMWRWPTRWHTGTTWMG